MREIARVVHGARPLSAALGDLVREDVAERLACEAAMLGASFVKLGFANTARASAAATLLRAAARGAATGRTGTRVIAVAYADATRVSAPAYDDVLDAAVAGRAHGVLLDTACKDGPALFSLVTAQSLAGWIGRAHDAGMIVALAGRLAAADLPVARELGADIAGVRGAACVGGRGGRVSADRVAALACHTGKASARLAPAADAVSRPTTAG
jgi:uncharacterized protein (UPF0264 family)